MTMILAYDTVWPASMHSVATMRTPCCEIWSAKSWSIAIRSARSRPLQPPLSNALRAAAMAASASAVPACATVAKGRPVPGSIDSNVLPSAASTNSPSMNSLYCSTEHPPSVLHLNLIHWRGHHQLHRTKHTIGRSMTELTLPAGADPARSDGKSLCGGQRRAQRKRPTGLGEAREDGATAFPVPPCYPPLARRARSRRTAQALYSGV